MRLFGLIGFPLSHSFSKKYFDTKFEKEQLTDCRFENFPLSSIRELRPQVLDRYPELAGLAVTIPYKHEVLRYLDDTSALPATLPACNCILVKDGRLRGFNTDYIGFEKSISPLLKPHHRLALVLGTGGAAAAVTYALEKMGIAYQVVSRQVKEGVSYTYENLSDAIIKTHTVIINTTPLGMYPETETFPPLPYASITGDHLLYDLVYNPSLTMFLQKGAEQGAVIQNGEKMLLLQAEENWRIWNQ